MRSPTIGSLFSGIGGLELGLEWATGGHTIWNCEIEPYCRSVLSKHWPDATQYDDVKRIDANVTTPDILCGGFPCSDVSVAGTRMGLAGEQSGLWLEFARIIRTLRPRFVFIENVTALRHLIAEGLGRVLGDLAASGYDAEWDCVPASAVGASHLRDRIFILGWNPALKPQEARLWSARSIDHDFPPAPGSPRWASWLVSRPGARPGLPEDEDTRRPRLRALGNAVVPQAVARAWELLAHRACSAA